VEKDHFGQSENLKHTLRMGLDYSYWIYLKKQNLKKTLEYLYAHSDEKSVGFKIENNQLYKIEKDRYFGLMKVSFDHFGLRQTLETCILVEADEVIMDYFMHIVEYTSPKYSDENETLNHFKGKDNKWSLGSIMISIKEASKHYEDCVCLHFWTLTSPMSRLFADSKSIDQFFKALCRFTEAEYGFLNMEDEGLRFIWYNAQEYDLNLPPDWQENTELKKQLGARK
jgi:hypothetical protein